MEPCMSIEQVAQHGQAVQAPEDFAIHRKCGGTKNALCAGLLGIAAQLSLGICACLSIGAQQGLQALL